ncbi:MAG: ribosomal RNA small subunit methyltransferase A [Clostridia bacterium]|nr:ribosomal RNA small subunit methyltransferase A [Clostridia bacterium]
MDFEFKKKFGQNFLTDTNLLTQIAEKSGIMSGDVVVEIGAGKGALTEVLSKFASKVYSFEIDSDLFEFLSEKFSGTNVEFTFKDIMQITDEELLEVTGGEKFKLVANLPYYITSPIITRFIENPNCTSITVMVQEEVADRIIAEPRTKDYGVLTIICRMGATAKKVLRVNRKMFYPVPNVDSAVVRLDKFENSAFDNGFIKFVKAAFSMRRKKLSSNLEQLGLKKADTEKTLEECGFGALARAEELSIADFEKIYKILCDKSSK